MSKNTPKRFESLEIKKPGSPYNFSAYSKFIQWMRILIPLGLSVLVATLFLWPQLKASLPDITESDVIGDIGRAENVLINPKFESLDRSFRPYSITAEKAVLRGVKKDDIQLVKPLGEITLSGQRTMSVKASAGVYNQIKQTLYLDNDVVLVHSLGYTLQTPKLFIDLKQAIVHAEQRVEIISEEAHLVAPSLVITEEGNNIKFTGPVTAKFTPEEEPVSGE